jgi:hypothetical protein
MIGDIELARRSACRPIIIRRFGPLFGQRSHNEKTPIEGSEKKGPVLRPALVFFFAAPTGFEPVSPP